MKNDPKENSSVTWLLLSLALLAVCAIYYYYKYTSWEPTPLPAFITDTASVVTTPKVVFNKNTELYAIRTKWYEADGYVRFFGHDSSGNHVFDAPAGMEFCFKDSATAMYVYNRTKYFEDSVLWQQAKQTRINDSIFKNLHTYQ